MDLKEKINRKWPVVQRLGLWNAIRYRLWHARGRRPGWKDTPYTLKPKGYPHPLFLRCGTSDPHVFRQIFIEQEYAPLALSRDIRLIVDCGANVGFASAYFLYHYSKARVIAVEPDSDSWFPLERNLRSFGDRVQIVHAGIWSHETGLVVCPFAPGEEWRTQVRECLLGETPDVQATDIPALLAASGRNRIDLLKVDIEGSEDVLFGTGSCRWLGAVDNIVVELHDQERKGVFFKALADFRYDLSTSGELTVCQNIRGKGATA